MYLECAVSLLMLCVESSLGRLIGSRGMIDFGLLTSKWIPLWLFSSGRLHQICASGFGVTRRSEFRFRRLGGRHVTCFCGFHCHHPCWQGAGVVSVKFSSSPLPISVLPVTIRRVRTRRICAFFILYPNFFPVSVNQQLILPKGSKKQWSSKVGPLLGYSSCCPFLNSQFIRIRLPWNNRWRSNTTIFHSTWVIRRLFSNSLPMNIYSSRAA